MPSYTLPKRKGSPVHLWLQIADEQGNILENRRRFVTFRIAQQLAALIVRTEAHSVLIIHGAANPSDPPPQAILASFCREPLTGHQEFK